METDDVAACLGKSSCHTLSIGVVREAGSAVEDHAPKLGRRAVFKGKLIAIHTAKAVLAGGSLIRKYPGNIYGHPVRIKVNRHISGHENHLFFNENIILLYRVNFNLKYLFYIFQSKALGQKLLIIKIQI
jgi:hypothetical protein